MIIREKDLGQKNNGGIKAVVQSFVFNYDGSGRSDLKESHKATASDEVLDKIDSEIRSTEKMKRKK